MKTEFEKCLAGEVFNGGDEELQAMTLKTKRLLAALNAVDFADKKRKRQIMQEMFGAMGDNVHIDIDFHCEYGKNIFLGNNVIINMNSTFVDNNRIEIGDNVLIASNVQIYTATHSTRVKERLVQEWDGTRGFCNVIARPVKIEDNVWIGGGVIILPGVTIGKNSVIGAGSVVTRSIPADSVAVGNPCRVIKHVDNDADTPQTRPPLHDRKDQLEAFNRLLDVMDQLRQKCPWDKKQTNESLRPNTIEETYELCDALIRDDKSDICKELGDVLLHVIFYAKIGSETGDFDIKDVCDRLCEKLIYRHPHVFGTVKADTAGEVCKNWEQLKLHEKGGNKTVLSGVPAALPSLVKAYRVQDKAANVGFDWERREQVWDKVKEEIKEFEAEVGSMDKPKAEAEFGDVLFSLVNAARLYKINPDNALEHANQKFIRRFNYVEAGAKAQGRSLSEMTLEEMDKLWNEAKAKEESKE